MKYLVSNQSRGFFWQTNYSQVVNPADFGLPTSFDTVLFGFPTTININNITISGTIVNTIDSLIGTMNVEGKSYSNVVKVKTDIQNLEINVSYTPSIFPIQVITTINQQDIRSYYSPKFGEILRDYKLNITASVPSINLTRNIIDADRRTTLISSNIQ